MIVSLTWCRGGNGILNAFEGVHAYKIVNRQQLFTARIWNAGSLMASELFSTIEDAKAWCEQGRTEQ